MKIFSPIVLAFVFAFVLTSCQREISFENIPVINSNGTLKSSVTGDCLGATVNGVYKENTALTSDNSIDIQVDVAATGSYSISTDTLNGISFSAKGVFNKPGTNTVHLQANGKPLAAAVTSFSVQYAGSVCMIPVTITGTGTANPAAVYSLGASNGNCTGVVLAGAYAAGATMTSANTAKIQVTVTTAGSYSISTAQVNGISFKATGNFSTTGAQTVTLTATGTATAAGVKSFATSNTSGNCSFDVTFTAAAPAAVFTLAGAPGACSTPAISGTYAAGTALSSANTVGIKVNVTTAGTYAITTGTVNGMQFSASGVFSAAGSNIPVILTGSGTPLNAGTSTFTPGVNGSNCSFDIPVTPATTASGNYSCKIDGVFTTFNALASASVIDGFGSPYLFLDGYTVQPNGDNQPELKIFITNNTKAAVGPGTYNEKNFISPTGYRIEVDLNIVNPDLSVTIWNTSSNLLSANPPFTIVVSSITSTRVKGTFSGSITNVLQGSTVIKKITEGVFDLPIQ